MEFQSLIGELKTLRQCRFILCYLLFQSLIGELKTWIVGGKMFELKKFQSLIGELKTSFLKPLVNIHLLVSIPHRRAKNCEDGIYREWLSLE